MEDGERLSIADLFRKRLVKFDGIAEGVCRGTRWRTHLSETGSYIEVNGRRWSLVLIVQESIARAQWPVQGSEGKRYRHLLITPSGQVGTRGELVALYGLRYRSQRQWSKQSQLAYRRHKIIEHLEGPVDLDWVKNHETYVPKKPKRQRWNTYARLTRSLVCR